LLVTFSALLNVDHLIYIYIILCFIASVLLFNFYILPRLGTDCVRGADSLGSVRWGAKVIFGLKALGFRSKVAKMAFFRVASCLGLFSQQEQLQASVQYSPALKHSQYNFKHLEFLQLQPFRKTGGLEAFPELLLPLKLPLLLLLPLLLVSGPLFDILAEASLLRISCPFFKILCFSISSSYSVGVL